MTKEDRLRFGDRVWGLRERHHLRQVDLAERFGLTLGTVKNLEGGRFGTPRILRLWLRAVERHPDLMTAVVEEEARLGDSPSEMVG